MSLLWIIENWQVSLRIDQWGFGTTFCRYWSHGHTRRSSFVPSAAIRLLVCRHMPRYKLFIIIIICQISRLRDHIHGGVSHNNVEERRQWLSVSKAMRQCQDELGITRNTTTLERVQHNSVCNCFRQNTTTACVVRPSVRHVSQWDCRLRHVTSSMQSFRYEQLHLHRSRRTDRSSWSLWRNRREIDRRHNTRATEDEFPWW